MPIFDFSTILPYLFTVVFVSGAGCVLTPSFMLLVVVIIGIDRRFSPPNSRFGPPNAGVFTAAEEGFSQGATELADIPAALRSGVPYGRPNAGGKARAENVALDWNSGGSSLRSLGGQSTADMKRELDLIDEQIRRNNKTPADVYPANKITVRCHGCRAHLRAGEGYSHYNVGTRGFFCRDCHQQKGLPLRDEDTGKKSQSVIMEGEKVENEV